MLYNTRLGERDEVPRCGTETNATIMSMYNTEEICIDCKALEEMRPDYKGAVEIERAAVRRGDYNFPGIGLRKNEAQYNGALISD